jgi:hypothetical protein
LPIKTNVQSKDGRAVLGHHGLPDMGMFFQEKGEAEEEREDEGMPYMECTPYKIQGWVFSIKVTAGTVYALGFKND